MYQIQWRVMQELCWAGWGKFPSPLAFRQSHMGNKKNNNNNNNNISEEKQTKTWGPLSLLYDLHHSQWDYLHCVNFFFFFFFNADVVIGDCAWQATTIMGTHVSGPLLKNHTAILLHALTDVPLLSLSF